MFCAQCGTENPEEARFCGNCGAAMDRAEPDAVTPPRPRVGQVIDLGTSGQGVPPGLKWGILALSILMPIVGVVMGTYYWAKGGSQERVAVGRLWLLVGLGLAILYTLMAGEGY